MSISYYKIKSAVAFCINIMIINFPFASSTILDPNTLYTSLAKRNNSTREIEAILQTARINPNLFYKSSRTQPMGILLAFQRAQSPVFLQNLFSVLVASGVNMKDVTDTNGLSVFHAYAMNSSQKPECVKTMVSFLLDQGMTPDLKDKHGLCAENYVAKRGNAPVYFAFKQTIENHKTSNQSLSEAKVSNLVTFVPSQIQREIVDAFLEVFLRQKVN